MLLSQRETSCQVSNPGGAPLVPWGAVKLIKSPGARLVSGGADGSSSKNGRSRITQTYLWPLTSGVSGALLIIVPFSLQPGGRTISQRDSRTGNAPWNEQEA
jgi:hypothetical protein